MDTVIGKPGSGHRHQKPGSRSIAEGCRSGLTHRQPRHVGVRAPIKVGQNLEDRHVGVLWAHVNLSVL